MKSYASIGTETKTKQKKTTSTNATTKIIDNWFIFRISLFIYKFKLKLEIIFYINKVLNIFRFLYIKEGKSTNEERKGRKRMIKGKYLNLRFSKTEYSWDIRYLKIIFKI